MIDTTTVIFTIDNILSHIYNPHLIIKAIDEHLVIRTDGFEKRVDYDHFRKTGDTVVKTFFKQDVLNVYNQVKQTFPSGRVGCLVQHCEENNVPYEVNDRRVYPTPHLDIEYIGPPSDGSNGLPARQYQLDAPQVLKKHGGRGILWHPTGSGKTITGARIIAYLKVNTLYMVPSLELLSQTRDSLQTNLGGQKIGVIGDGVWDPQPITVSTTATLWSRFEKPECKEFINNVELLIVDECHHVAKRGPKKSTKNKAGATYSVNSWYIIAINCPAYFRVGLTGTPGKEIEQKRAMLECAIGRVAQRITTRELIDLGVLSDVQVNMHTIKHTLKYYDHQVARKEGVLLNEPFNEYIVHVAIAELKAGKQVLLLTASKAIQGPMLSKIFSRFGYEVPFISGDDKRKARAKARDEFRAGTRRCLIGTVYKEGVDFPLCNCGINCDGQKDDKAVIQFLGRILRTAKGKGLAHLHDFKHEDNKYLKRHSKMRLTTYIEEDLEKIVTHKGITV